MNETYGIVEDPWVNKIEDDFYGLLIMSFYLKCSFDRINNLFEPEQINKNWKELRQQIILSKPQVKLLPPPIHEDLRLARVKFGL
jgi:hypothetical protein